MKQSSMNFGTAISAGKEKALSVTRINNVSDVESQFLLSPGYEQNTVGVV